MKIHDKFVIELREVIKGYGNDPTVQDPFKFPCDYKFYEIEGVAICEKSFKKMKRLEDEVNAVLDKIRAEIDEQYDRVHPYNISCAEGLEMALEIIDKYKAEREDVPDINNGNIYECSCGYGWDKSKVVRHHFCPNCGAKVAEGSGEE